MDVCTIPHRLHHASTCLLMSSFALSVCKRFTATPMALYLVINFCKPTITSALARDSSTSMQVTCFRGTPR